MVSPIAQHMAATLPQLPPNTSQSRESAGSKGVVSTGRVLQPDQAEISPAARSLLQAEEGQRGAQPEAATSAGSAPSEQATGSSEQKEPEQDQTGASKPRTPSEADLDQQELQQVRELQVRDREVRAHEQAHKASAGQYARGGPFYETQRGPDGQQYAVGGHVNIDTGKEHSPEATLRKAQQVRRAALAPAEPSSADRAVAAKASQLASEAQTEIRAEDLSGEGDRPQSAAEAIGPAPSTGASSNAQNSTELPPASTAAAIPAADRPSAVSTDQADPRDRQPGDPNQSGTATLRANILSDLLSA